MRKERRTLVKKFRHTKISSLLEHIASALVSHHSCHLNSCIHCADHKPNENHLMRKLKTLIQSQNFRVAINQVPLLFSHKH
jgi:hypothetical protein